MNDDPPRAADRDDRLDEAITEYLQATEVGPSPDRSAFLARYPDLADDLAQFLNDRAVFQKLIGPLVAPSSEPTVSACPQCRASLDTARPDATCGGCGWRVPGPGSADPFPVPHRVGRLELTTVVGRGAFGTVYKAWDPQLHKHVAVKALRNDPLAPPERLERFLRDPKIVSQLDHRGIVPVYYTGESAGVPFVVSEFVPGPTLAGLIRDNRPPVKDSATLVAALADALEHAHRRGVIHRDVKPANVLLKGDRHPLLTDFGLALWDGGDPTITSDHQVIGTLTYMSPEQARGLGHQVDCRSDVYSLGVVLYELLTGVRPFEGTVRGVFRQIEFDHPRPPRALDERVPNDLETICLKCLRKEPYHRYASAAELAADLRRYLASEPIHARPVGCRERLLLWGRRNPALAAALGFVALLMVATTAISAGWAVHSANQKDQIKEALAKAQLLIAESDLDRGLDEANRGDVGLGLLWMGRGLKSAPAQADDTTWALRANIDDWTRRHAALTHCVPPPPGKVLAFSPDGQFAWFVAPDGVTVRCWDLANNQVTGPELAHRREVQSLAISPDGKRIACGGHKLGVCIWDVVTGAPQPAPAEHLGVGGLTYSADSQALILGVEVPTSGAKPHTAYRVWDGSDLRPLAGVTTKGTGPVTLAAAHGNALLTAGLGDARVRRWDVTKGHSREQVLAHPGSIKVLAVSPDGRRALTGGDDRVARLWDLETDRLLAVLYHRNPVTAVAFGHEGKTLRTASAGDAVRVWDCPNDSDPAGALVFPGPVRALAVSPDGSHVATGADDWKVQLWKPTAGKLVPVGVPLCHPSPIRVLAFSPDGTSLATTTYQDPGAQLWDTATGKKQVYLEHPHRVRQAVFSPDGRRVATVGFDQRVGVWDRATGRSVLPKPLTNERAVTALAFNRDGGKLVTVGGDRLARRWDLATGDSLGDPLPHDGEVRAVLFHPTEATTLLTACDDGAARLWNLETGTPTGPPLIHGYTIDVAAFAPDGRTVLTGGREGTTRVWDLATGGAGERSLKHGGRVRAVAVGPDGRWAATASEDGTARVWALRANRSVGPPIRHEPSALCVVIDPLGDWVLTAGEDHVVRMRPAPVEVGGTPERVELWLQVVTGVELDRTGDPRPLDPTLWRERQAALRALGGPPR